MDFIKLVGEIIRQFPGQFILFVILPAIFGALTGVVSLKNQLESKQKVASVETEMSTVKEDVVDVNISVDTLGVKTGEHEELIQKLGEKDTEIEVLQIQLKKFQDRTIYIQEQIERLLSWGKISLNDFKELDKKYDDITEEEQGIIESAIKRYRNNITDELNKNIFENRLVDDRTKKTKKWSPETLYQFFGRSNAYWNTLELRIAAYNEVAILKNKYFVEELYKVATSNKNVKISLAAAYSLCIITNYAPYKRENKYQLEPKRKLVYDVPDFEQLTKWWNEEGKNNKAYNCPFELIDKNNQVDASYELPEQNITYKGRIELVESYLKEYPFLTKSIGELAYLKLLVNGKAEYDEIERLSIQACNSADDQVLPYLVLAYMSMQEKDYTAFRDYLDKGRKHANNLEEFISTTYRHDKLKEILNDPNSTIFYQ